MTGLEQLQLDKIAKTDHEIYALLKQRWSPRMFKDDKIPEKEIKQLFEAARWAASSSNLQPWRFIYAEKGTDAYDKIVACLSNFNKSWVINAPILIITAYKEKREDGEVNFHALHDLGLAVGNMSVQAQYMNIGIHQMAGIDWEKAQKTFKIPKGYHVATAIAAGYYGGDFEKLNEDLLDMEKSERERIPQKDFAYKDAWKE
ncbi:MULTISPECIES: nitroreductase family protein [Galbibacter]|uniref:Nitroreductase family protein n=1 Tax=Galbibacter pacificus TaxID=2996052 RepID=A0ABT6FQU3_9FLAO|nr:nitroreductase family protein [Galbibacter pacificus]MDG3581894.1 nitroreductase family protein [Galbibacter pacificus]MDG3585632.1 nitroreductase family protein [Galbibacter pacificus]